MDSGKLLQNDFAPAWLKLPDQEHRKPVAGTDHRLFSRSISERGEYHSRNGDQDPDLADLYSPIPKQHCNNNKNLNGNRLSSSGHHTTPKRDGTNIYDSMTSDSPMRQSPGDVRRRADKLSTGGGVNGTEQKSVDSRTQSIDDEFPSLNGDVHIDVCNKPLYSKVASQWDGSVRESSVASRSLSDSSPKTLILKSSAIKRSTVDADKPLSCPSLNPAALCRQNGLSSSRAAQKEPQSPVGVGVKALTACIKESGSRKSNFFKLMRREGHDVTASVESSPSGSRADDDDYNLSSDDKHHVTVHDAESTDTAVMTVNGSHKSAASPEHHSPIEVVLSSSYEAEQKLLREMGWSEADYDDDDNYEITEQEMKEFADLCSRLKQNGDIGGHQRLQSRPSGGATLSATLSTAPVDTDTSDIDDDDTDLSDS